jgi:hypothetical protein
MLLNLQPNASSVMETLTLGSGWLARGKAQVLASMQTVTGTAGTGRQTSGLGMAPVCATQETSMKACGMLRTACVTAQATLHCVCQRCWLHDAWRACLPRGGSEGQSASTPAVGVMHLAFASVKSA